MVTGEIAVDQHDVAILAALGLLDANDLLCAVDVLDLEPDYLAGAHPAAIAAPYSCSPTRSSSKKAPAKAGAISRCKSGPGKAVAGRLEASVA